jgi:hypothetical protein
VGSPDRRRPAGLAPQPPAGWLGLSDEDLLYEIESLGDGLHDRDDVLLEVVRSDRHFFIRQEAAKKIRDPDLLKTHAEDRHIGQILVRVMTRAADVEYLQRLVSETRYLEVRKAAESQLLLIAERLRSSGRPR